MFSQFMNRDAWLATIIGFGIGLVLTGLLLLTPKIAPMLPKKVDFTLPWLTKGPIPTVTPTPAIFAVSIDSPLPESIADNREILISGITAGEATLVIEGNVDETVVVASNQGKYAAKINLTEGKNEITVTSYKDGQQTSKKLTIYYTEEEL